MLLQLALGFLSDNMIDVSYNIDLVIWNLIELLVDFPGDSV